MWRGTNKEIPIKEEEEKQRIVVGLLAAKINGQQRPEQMDLRRKKKRPGVGFLGRSGCQVS
jgi:hypothetical protein